MNLCAWVRVGAIICKMTCWKVKISSFYLSWRCLMNVDSDFLCSTMNNSNGSIETNGKENSKKLENFNNNSTHLMLALDYCLFKPFDSCYRDITSSIAKLQLFTTQIRHGFTWCTNVKQAINSAGKKIIDLINWQTNREFVQFFLRSFVALPDFFTFFQLALITPIN